MNFTHTTAVWWGKYHKPPPLLWGLKKNLKILKMIFSKVRHVIVFRSFKGITQLLLGRVRSKILGNSLKSLSIKKWMMQCENIGNMVKYTSSTLLWWDQYQNHPQSLWRWSFYFIWSEVIKIENFFFLMPLLILYSSISFEDHISSTFTSEIYFGILRFWQPKQLTCKNSVASCRFQVKNFQQ